MQKYVEVLESHEVDVDTLVTMDDQDLKEIGISTFGELTNVMCKKCLGLQAETRFLDNDKTINAMALPANVA